MISRSLDSTIGATVRGVPTVMRPVPIRSAPSPARAGAPAFPGDPATMPACPKVPLCEDACRGGIKRTDQGFLLLTVECGEGSMSSTNSRGMPISHHGLCVQLDQWRLPHRAQFLGNQMSQSNQLLRPYPRIAPVSLSNPEGMSTATVEA